MAERSRINLDDFSIDDDSSSDQDVKFDLLDGDRRRAVKEQSSIIEGFKNVGAGYAGTGLSPEKVPSRVAQKNPTYGKAFKEPSDPLKGQQKQQIGAKQADFHMKPATKDSDEESEY